MSLTSRSADHVYYSASIAKTENAILDSYTPLQFSDYRNTAIINNCGEYEMSIVRFQIDSCSLPLYIAEIEPNQADPFKTIYKVNLSYLTGGVETFLAAPISVEWTQVDFTEGTPGPPSANPLGLQDNSRAYYSYSYTDLIEDINEALDKAKADLDVLFPALAGIEAPVLVWNQERGTCDFYAREDTYAEGLANQIKVHISKSLYPLFSSIPVEKYPINTNRAEYRIIFKDSPGSVVDNFFGLQRAIIVKQEYTTLETWSPFNSLCFTTTVIPIISENLSPAQVYENGSLRPVNNSLNNNLNIITDISSQDFSMRSNLLYVPSGEFRFISLYGDQPLNKIDFQVYLLFKNGSRQAFYLHANTSCNIKVLFRRKSQYLQK